MAQFNLDPAQGEECGVILRNQMNGAIFEPILEAYKAMTESGENTVTNAYLAKFQKLEQVYNDDVLPELDSINKNLGEFTELAYIMNNKSVDEDVKRVDVDPIGDSGFAEGFSI